ncbi:MAG: phenylacetate--CoA ligase [SAR324 cluster bacterium]|uniref:Phenylacetate-coenzyme A ligase n=1 Tax=SAR324 cluster bacterium TaxID=2024889 RepID=A0A2A4T717_9DELT|nr:MAG: phenylacetate--CoA ligase [SAR324 cluster bacterium]
MSVNKYDFVSRETREVLQLKRLQETVERVYQLVPFYQEAFRKAGIHPKDIRSLKDLSNLPFTVKQDLRDNYPFGLFAANQDQIVRIHSSSGTTGKLTVVGYTAHDMDVWNEVMMRSLIMSNVSAADTMLNAYGYGLFTGGLGLHTGAEKLGCAVIPSSGGFTSRQLMLMKDFKASVLACTPTFAMHLYEKAISEGYNIREDFNLKVGLFGAEPASKGLKQQVAKSWGLDYIEIYGLSEIIGPGASCSCPHSDQLHIFEDHFLPEIIDPVTGDVLPDGQQGELVFTTITKQGIPLIRYRTKDLTTLYREPCQCGRTLVRMDSVVGRSDDMLIVSGVNVFPSQVEHVLSLIEGITLNYVIIMEKKGFIDRMSLQVEVQEGTDMKNIEEMGELTKTIQADLHNHLSINTRVELVEPQALERSLGKAVRVIDKRK